MIKLVVLNKKSIILPRIEKEKFIRLLKLGLEYNRNQGFFYLKRFDNIEKISDTLSAILNDKVLFLQNCLLCDKNFPCSDCEYTDFCVSKDLPFQCVCSECLKESRTYQKVLK